MSEPDLAADGPVAETDPGKTPLAAALHSNCGGLVKASLTLAQWPISDPPPPYLGKNVYSPAGWWELQLVAEKDTGQKLLWVVQLQVPVD